ncbi:hypothetical protein COOONC_07442 [Cooperia oncophora]
MLAWSYGYPRVMSSYYFTTRDQGPPTDGVPPKYEARSPQFDRENKCTKVWVVLVAHRSPSIRRMVKFRSDVQGAAPAHIVTEDHRIAFARLERGFFALNSRKDTWKR